MTTHLQKALIVETLEHFVSLNQVVNCWWFFTVQRSLTNVHFPFFANFLNSFNYCIIDIRIKTFVEFLGIELTVNCKCYYLWDFSSFWKIFCVCINYTGSLSLSLSTSGRIIPPIILPSTVRLIYPITFQEISPKQ